MKLRMAEKSLFATLLRSSWWISLAIALVIALAAAALLPPAYAAVGAAGGLPFLVIAAIAAWKQLRSPSPAQVERTLLAVGRMSAAEFITAMEEAFRREGYEVRRLAHPGADLEMLKSGRKSLLSCKRWKAARTGVEPLRELHAAAQALEAQGCLYVATADITDNARQFGRDKGIELIEAQELARLLHKLPGVSARG